MVDNMTVIEVQWAKRYKRLGFNKENIRFYEDTPLPNRQRDAEWRRLDHIIWQDMMKNNNPQKVQTFGVITDTIDGVHNPVDGKRYDSKSRYYQKLKDTGHHIYEGKPSGKKLLNQGDHNVTKELKEAAQAVGFI